MAITNKNNNKYIKRNLKKNNGKFFLIILFFLIGTPIYFRQYVITYPDPSDRNDLSVKGMFLD